MVRGDVWKKRPKVLAYWRFAAEARLAATGHPERKLNCAVLALRATCWFSPPPSWSAKRKREAAGGPHRQRPDADNCAKAILDPLLEDDGQVALIRCRKRWCREGEDPRVEVTLVIG